MNRQPKQSDTKFFSNHTKYKNVFLTVYSLLIEMEGWLKCN